MSDYFLRYDNEAGGPFTEGEILTFGGGAVAELIRVRTIGAVKEMYVSLISGTVPADNESITGGTSGATGNVEASIVPVYALKYPAYMHHDISVALNGDTRWTGPTLGVTHSCRYDAEAGGPFVVGEILTFGNGGTAELVTLTDNGTTGELGFRLITLPAPLDNESISGGTSSATANVDGVVHRRTYRPIHLHRFFGDLGDDESAVGDDLHDIIGPDPSDRSTDDIITLLNNYNIDDTVALHMYGGSIVQDAGDTRYSGLSFNLAVNSPDTSPVLIQDGQIVTNHWSNGYNPDSLKGQMRFLIKTRANGADIDGGRVTARVLELGDTYFTGGTTLGTGEGSISLFSSSDLNNQTDAATIATWASIVLTEGYQLIDHNNGNGPQPFYQQWDRGTQSRGDLYERTKWIQRRGSAETIHGINGQLFVGADTNFAYDNEVGGPFTEAELVAWGTSFDYDTEVGGPFTLDEYVSFTNGAVGKLVYLNDQGATGTMVVAIEPGSGSVSLAETVTGLTSGATANVSASVANNGVDGGVGLLLALDDGGTTGNLYLQMIAGLRPVDGLTIWGRTSGATADVNGSVTPRTINTNFLGQWTGTGFITNYGITLEPADATNADQFTDLLGGLQQPPNNVTFTFSGLVPDEDYIIAANNNAGDLDFGQLSANGAQTAGAGTVVVNEAIPSDTPLSGTIRCLRADGKYDRVPYASWSGSTFTLVGTLPSNLADAANVFISYVDKLAENTTEEFTVVFSSPRTILGKIRDGKNTPIKTSTATGVLGSAGGSASFNRISDE